jgi:hypothetical protein
MHSSQVRSAGLCVAIALLLGLVPEAGAQQTVAERSGFTSTSSHADVLAFLGTLATSAEGRRVPWVLASRPLVASPAEAHRSGKPVVYIQGNIHGGEVEGKEAAQMLLRDLTVGSLRPLLDSLILIVVPIYNTDGNDAFAPGSRNRPGQNGPDTVGRRPNGLGLDLNRDYIKQEAPETRGAARLLAEWDPDLLMDLHTTNGSYHGYVLTYAPGLNPNSPPANDFVRDLMLPAIRLRMRERHGAEVFSYGNFRNQHPDSLVLGWETYDARPRFGTNWMGMRGRLSILSEAYSNADFETRVRGTWQFVQETLRFLNDSWATIRPVLAASDRWRPDSVTVRSVLAPPTPQDVIAEITEPGDGGRGGFARRKRTGVFRTIRMPVFDRFAPARREAMPAVYLIPASESGLAESLRAQGIVVERSTEPWSGPAEAFRIDSLASAPFPFEGHRTAQVEGQWRSHPTTLAPGWFLVSTDQRLGVLAAYLLEPASEDGYVAWNRLDRVLRRGADAPILRARTRPTVPTLLLP